ncbi:MAG: hypothetical protein KDI73_11655 [Candidatus Competibacteraceae bacterium]|nr:hypothetical protein [Candidatus Competibacteraceae bacterium]MCB1822216.1 hypothetical protein [Candidatus Competibacteraceae bacterium]HPE71577.1 hypothetical protein [Candidatus Competibacter sp.]HRW64505.1 hypothetical protein [Candidatus Competibacter sp.]
MTDQTQAIRETAAKPTKKTYAPPRILSRERLEAVAGVCSGGTSKTNIGSCPSGPVAS